MSTLCDGQLTAFYPADVQSYLLNWIQQSQVDITSTGQMVTRAISNAHRHMPSSLWRTKFKPQVEQPCEADVSNRQEEKDWKWGSWEHHLRRCINLPWNLPKHLDNKFPSLLNPVWVGISITCTIKNHNVMLHKSHTHFNVCVLILWQSFQSTPNVTPSKEVQLIVTFSVPCGISLTLSTLIPWLGPTPPGIAGPRESLLSSRLPQRPDPNPTYVDTRKQAALDSHSKIFQKVMSSHRTDKKTEMCKWHNLLFTLTLLFPLSQWKKQ